VLQCVAVCCSMVQYVVYHSLTHAHAHTSLEQEPTEDKSLLSFVTKGVFVARPVDVFPLEDTRFTVCV